MKGAGWDGGWRPVRLELNRPGKSVQCSSDPELTEPSWNLKRLVLGGK